MAAIAVLGRKPGNGEAMSAAPPFDGQHWLAEFYEAAGLADPDFIRVSLVRAVEAAGVTLLRVDLHHFGIGMGVAGMALLAESHISIHTWPEHGYAAIDLFMCGSAARPQRALAVLEEAFRPKSTQVRRFARGFNSGAAKPGKSERDF